jgi:hypothetical protein
MWLAVTNAIAYSTVPVITVVKGFTVLVPAKHFKKGTGSFGYFYQPVRA